MSTNAVVAAPQGDFWRGRYVHWDGNPKSKLPQLRALIERDGVERVLKVLTEEHYGWSSLSLRQRRAEKSSLGKRGRWVAGYGEAYTTAEGQSHPDDWHTSERADTPWAYVLYPNFITVLWGDANERWHWVGAFRHDKPLSGELLTEIECGEQYERCEHYGWVHFPEAEGTSYTAEEWLSLDVEPRLGNASAVVLRDGQQLPIGFSGGICFADGTPAWRHGVDTGNRPIYWSTATKNPDGTIGADIIVGRRTKAGLKLRHPIVLPANAVRGEVLVPAGTVVHQ